MKPNIEECTKNIQDTLLHRHYPYTLLYEFHYGAERNCPVLNSIVLHLPEKIDIIRFISQKKLGNIIGEGDNNYTHT